MPLSTGEKISLKRKTPQELVSYLQSGKFSDQDLDDLAAGDAAFYSRLAEARTLLEQMPNPVEIGEFEALTASVTNRIDDPATEEALAAYIHKWKTRANAREHITAAMGYQNRLAERKAFRTLEQRMAVERQRYAATGQLPAPELTMAVRSFCDMHANTVMAGADVRQAQMWLQEIKDMYSKVVAETWASLFDAEGKLRSIDELENFLTTLPTDDMQRAQADDAAWEWVGRQSNPLAAAQRYDTLFRHNGIHSGQVARLRDSALEWSQYSNADIYTIINFLENNPNHPYAAAAGMRIRELKAEAMENLRRNPTSVAVTDFRQMLESPYFTKEELMEAAGMDEQMLMTNVYNYENVWASLPRVPAGRTPFGSGTGEPGITDVVFFGINSSGKTCVLSGLLRHDNLWFDDHSYSGDYGAMLRAYANRGFAFSGTPRGFVATIKAEVTDLDNSNYKYKFNLFEMAGEDFRNDIANSHDEYGRLVRSFEDMGANAAEILRSGNDKLFFILVDPTVDIRQEEEQQKALNALISLMFGDENGYNPNEDIMSCVTGLHFIVTKSDTLGSGDVRRAASMKVQKVLNPAARNKVIEGCRQFGINASKDPNLDGVPRVFPFSLGRFTVGNMFRYDPTGATTILRVICDYISPERKEGFGQKIRNIFTKPII